MNPAILPRASKIYFDSQEAVLSESGDILLPLEEGIITEEDFTGNIGDVIKGNLGITLKDCCIRCSSPYFTPLSSDRQTY